MAGYGDSSRIASPTWMTAVENTSARKPARCSEALDLLCSDERNVLPDMLRLAEVSIAFDAAPQHHSNCIDAHLRFASFAGNKDFFDSHVFSGSFSTRPELRDR